MRTMTNATRSTNTQTSDNFSKVDSLKLIFPYENKLLFHFEEPRKEALVCLLISHSQRASLFYLQICFSFFILSSNHQPSMANFSPYNTRYFFISLPVLNRALNSNQATFLLSSHFPYFVALKGPLDTGVLPSLLSLPRTLSVPFPPTREIFGVDKHEVLVEMPLHFIHLSGTSEGKVCEKSDIE